MEKQWKQFDWLRKLWFANASFAHHEIANETYAVKPH